MIKSKRRTVLYHVLDHTWVCRMFVCLVLFIFIKPEVSSQQNENAKINFIGMSFSGVMPQGNLKNNSEPFLPGFELHYLRQFRPQSPVFWGFSTYYFSLGSRNAVITEFLDNTIVDFRYRTVSNVMGINGIGRIYPDIYLWKAEFFAELILGGKWFFTNTSKTITDTDDSDLRYERGSFALDYGLAIGLNIPLYKSLYLNFKSTYLPGTATSYHALNEKPFIEFSTLEGFDLKNSNTEILRLDLGITYAF